ncbi:MAG: DUF1616 domain-containing protein [Candidatus Bathyarchaeia archaeon]|jgi:uncharacterized membrane protein
MNVVQYKTVLCVATFVVALFVASPAIEQLTVFPSRDSFSELGLLGPQHIAADYPSAVTANQDYSVFLEVGNQLGYAAYYMIQVKLQNKTQFDTNTPTDSLYNTTVFVANQQTTDIPLTFSIDYSYNQTLSQVNLSQVSFNGFSSKLETNPFAWEPEKVSNVSYLVFELWLYNTTLGDFENHKRSVNLMLTIP